MNKKIKIFDLTKQYKSLSNEINSSIKKVISSGNYILGENVKNIELKFAKFIDSKYAISCNSGTDALLLSLRSLNIGRGDEVITTPFTYFATAEAITLAGAKPIFIDIDPRTFNIDYTKIPKAITKKTKAVMPVHIFGQMSDVVEIKKICKEYNLKLIEDCAQSFGAKKNKSHAGTFGDFGCFSFFPTKNLGCAGDGGMIVTNNYQNMNMLKQLRNHGGTTRNLHNYVGYNSRLDEIQASILLIKLKYINRFNANRRKIANLYKSQIKNNKIITPYELDSLSHVYNQFTLIVQNRNKFIKYISKYKIPYGVYYPLPIYKQKALKLFNYKYKLKHTEQITKQCISLPIYPELENSSVAYISEVINDYK